MATSEPQKWVSLITGLEYGLELNGQSSEIMKYASSLIAVLHSRGYIASRYRLLTCIYVLKW